MLRSEKKRATTSPEGKGWRRHPDSNRGIKDLQSSAFPLGYADVVGIVDERPRPVKPCGDAVSTSTRSGSDSFFLIKWYHGFRPFRVSAEPEVSLPATIYMTGVAGFLGSHVAEARLLRGGPAFGSD